MQAFVCPVTGNARVDIHTRVIYRRTGDLIHYVLYGSHDQIRRFLKTL